MPKPESRETIFPLRAKGLGVELGGTPALVDLGFALTGGGCSVILGPNGSGKSTLLRVGHGLLQPSTGTLRWCGDGAREAAQRQAMVLQRPVLLRRRVAANLAYPLRLRGVTAEDRQRRIAETLERTRLTPLAERPARSLSVGEQQRVAIARAWVTEPEILWLDEPASALDPGAARALEETIRDVQASGTKVVMTTHDLAQARRLADEVLFLHRGRLLEQTPADTFFALPRSEEARTFLKGELLP